MKEGAHRSREKALQEEIEQLKEENRNLRRERDEIEGAKRKSSGRLGGMVDIPGIGILIFNEEGRLIDANNWFLRMFGYSREEVAAGILTWKAMTPPEYLDISEQQMKKLAELGFIGPYEKEYLHKDGSRSWMLFTGASYGDGTAIEFCLDVGDRKKAEENLRKSEQALRESSSLAERRSAELEATIEAIAAPLMIYGPQGTILRMNKAAKNLLGYTPEMEEKPMPERIKWLRMETPEGVPLSAENSPLARALRGETVANEILVFHAPQAIRASVTAAPLLSSHGRMLGVVITFVDLTTLYDLQREREVVLHTISHDLRTPLTAILGYAELMANLPRQGEDQIYLDAICTAARQMHIMIEDLVEMARLEGAEITLEMATIRLDQFLSSYLERSATVLDTSRIVPDVPELPPVTADPSRLERIFTNLLTNALKYSPPDSRVDVRARQRGELIVVSVHDYGKGIDPEDLPHIFERFYQVKSGKKAGSVGLGLYIAHALVEAHGGHITAESTPGAGTVFSFTLPVRQEKRDGSDEQPE